MFFEIWLGTIIRFTRFNKIIQIWQKFIYNYAIQKVCKQYPNIVDELVSNSDYPEIIKPGFFGKVDGKKIHDKYWTQLTP